MTALIPETRVGGVSVPVSAKQPALLIHKDGITNLDLLKNGSRETAWKHIKKLDVYEDKLVFTSREINGNTFKATVKTDKDDPRAITFWRDAQGGWLLIWMTNSGKLLGQLSDGTPVYRMQVPEIEFHCDFPDNDWQPDEINVPEQKIVVDRRLYGSIEELNEELAANNLPQISIDDIDKK